MIVETLETRRMMSVSAQVVAGVLVVAGDTNPNHIEVFDQGDNQFIVLGDGELIPGSEDGPFPGVTNAVVVAAGGGDDVVDYESGTPFVSPLQFGAAISLGSGDDDITANISDAGNRLSVDGGAGDDLIIGSAIGGASLAFTGGAGSDGGSAFAVGAGSVVSIDAGIGDDVGRAGSGYTDFNLEADGGGAVVYQGGAGDDVVTAQAFGPGSTFTVSGGAGDDRFVGLFVDAGSTGYVYGGNGNDAIQVNAVVGKKSIDVNGNVPTLDGKLYVWGEAGNDDIRITAVGGLAFVYGGNGNDTLTLGNPFQPSAAGVTGHLTFDGGANRDLLVAMLSQEDSSHLTLIHVEKVSGSAGT